MSDNRYIKAVAAASASRSTATLMKTGQTTSYRTGDDGDIEAGRATSFLVLDVAPTHNNGAATLNTTTNRFTDTLGGSTYANDWVLDWSTWNGSTLLGYYRVQNGTNINWNNSIDASLGTFGGFTSCRLPNMLELINVVNFGISSCLNYAPFNLNGFSLWSSTTPLNSTSTAFVLLATINNYFSVATKSVLTNAGLNCRYIPVRTFSLSTSNVLS